MRSISLSWILIVGAASCGGASSQVLGAGDSGSHQGDGGALPDTGLPTPTCEDPNVTSVAGTWDLIASGTNGDNSTATLTIDPSTFTFSSGDRSLSFHVAGSSLSLVWTDGSKTVPINASHTATAVDVGLEPLAAGGSWIFSSTTSSENCTATLGNDSFTATCADVHSTPFGTLNGTITAQRSQKLDSLFGELGGTWHVVGSDRGGVDATFSGSTFTASLFGSSGNGSMTLRVCNGVATGSTSAGVEISARRR
jgi:hypothetical protein